MMNESSSPVELEIKDNMIMVKTKEVIRPLFFNEMAVSQAASGQKPVYLDASNPYWRYTLYLEPVSNSLVYHVVSIDGKKPTSTDEIFTKLLEVQHGL